jgi:23S rRNA (cytosine1962-C5)-methyltransferase
MAIAYLLPGKEIRVFSGHPWIFRSDIERVAGKCTPGDIVTVMSGKSQFLARAVYNPQSQIALRILSYNDEAIDDAFIRNRVSRAVAYRRKFADLTSCRLIFAESDGLPAVIVDSFGGVLVLQCLSLGMERFKKTIAETLTDELRPVGIYERNDVPVRDLEGLKQITGLLSGSVPEQVEMTENGIRILVDVMHGQKTGYFLDQKENRAAIAPFAANANVLDCFTHTGGFALHAAHYGAKEVTGVDISDYACRCALENAKLNRFDNARFVTANVFDYLTDQSVSRDPYDMIILDPPAFTKTRTAVEAASRGYKEINLRAMKMIRDGGYLITCSCSQHIAPDAFREIVKDAARDARVHLVQVEYRTQGRDHPILPASPETQYLKCGIFRIVR